GGAREHGVEPVCVRALLDLPQGLLVGNRIEADERAVLAAHEVVSLLPEEEPSRRRAAEDAWRSVGGPCLRRAGRERALLHEGTGLPACFSPARSARARGPGFRSR